MHSLAVLYAHYIDCDIKIKSNSGITQFFSREEVNIVKPLK